MKKKKMTEKINFFSTNVSRPSNPPDELAQHVSKKIPVGRVIPPFFCKSAESGRFFIYLHDSNSIFWAQGIKSEGVLGRTVHTYIHTYIHTNIHTYIHTARSKRSVAQQSTASDARVHMVHLSAPQPRGPFFW